MFASSRPLLAILTLSIAAFAPTLRAADPPSSAEAKLRETLRNTLLQVRTLQGEKDTLQAEKDALDAEHKTVVAELEKLKKESAEAKAEAEKNAATLGKRVEQMQTDNGYLVEKNKTLETNLKISLALSEKREAARVKLNSENIVLQRRVADQFRKNQEMFRLGNEILTRYENFSLGTAITAREPFVGTTRVKLQNLVQDYADKLQAERLKPEPAPAKAEPAPAARKPAAPAPKAKPAEKASGPAQAA